MPFRDRLRKAFKSDSASSSKTASPIIPQPEPRWPSNVYRPGEPMPRLKYRAPVKKEHKEKLEAFNFGSAWRRKSQVSLYSPMGSRRSSHAGPRPSIDARRRSSCRPASRSNSVISGTFEIPRRTSYYRSAQPPALAKVESEGDLEVESVEANAARKRNSALEAPAAGPHPPRRLSRSAYSAVSTKSSIETLQETPDYKADSGPPSQLNLDLVTNDAAAHKMWSADDLAAAMRRNRLASITARPDTVAVQA